MIMTVAIKVKAAPHEGQSRFVGGESGRGVVREPGCMVPKWVVK
jgi:hypothetical protein